MVERLLTVHMYTFASIPGMPTTTHDRLGMSAPDAAACMEALLALCATPPAAPWQHTLVLFAASLLAAMPGQAAALLHTCHSALASPIGGTGAAVAAVLVGLLSAQSLQPLTVHQRRAVGASLGQLLQAKETGACEACVCECVFECVCLGLMISSTRCRLARADGRTHSFQSSLTHCFPLPNMCCKGPYLTFITACHRCQVCHHPCHHPRYRTASSSCRPAR